MYYYIIHLRIERFIIIVKTANPILCTIWILLHMLMPKLLSKNVIVGNTTLKWFFSIAIVADHQLQSLTSYPQLFEGIADIDFLTPKHSSCFPTHPSPIPTSSRATFFQRGHKEEEASLQTLLCWPCIFSNQSRCTATYRSTTLMNLSWDLMMTQL